jgi:AraC family transcriptional regulator of adaptative response/methylated-DNA-[protein]-cysteine methyltransferase
MNVSEKNLKAAAAIQADPRWAWVQARDTAANGRFYYSVKTTGVYCLPSCHARPAKPENVAFHATGEEAEQAGFRACKRCEPNQWTKAEREATEHLIFATGTCSLGTVLVARNGRGVCAILLGDSPAEAIDDLLRRFPLAAMVEGDHRSKQLLDKVVALVESPRTPIDLPMDAHGTDFQGRVWQALRDIPAGATASYTDIAGDIGAPRSVRAVAQACAANHLAVVIPCHRMIRSDGKLSGYRWGVERKRLLLAREANA